MNKSLVLVGELCEFAAYVCIGCCVAISWVGLMAVVGVVLRPEFPIVSNMVTVSMALLYLFGLVFFSFKHLDKKGVV